MANYSRKKSETFKDRFNDLCEHSTIPTIGLATALGVSKQTISAWRIGTRSPKDLTVKAIAEYFGVNVDWLMGYDVEKYKSFSTNELFSTDFIPQLQSEEAKILARGVDKLSPEQREQALAVIKAMFAQHPELFEE